MNEIKQALVIGIDAYSGGIEPLTSAVRDATAIAEQLEQAHGYEVTLLTDDQATSENIMSSLSAVAAAGLAESSSFVLYYAGHGIAADDQDGTGPQGFLVAHDAVSHDQDTWLGMNPLRSQLEKLPCRHLMLVLDCCYAGAFRWGPSTRKIRAAQQPLYTSQYERYRDGKAWHVLTSAAADEEADDAMLITADRRHADSRDGHSPFAHALMDGLAGQADSSRGELAADGVITATELYQYIYEMVAVNDRQTPGIFPLRTDNKGEFVFLAPGADLKLEPDPPLDDGNNPWLDLAPYSSADRELFFGRDDAAAELVSRVDAGRFVALVGASGTGKSSLIRAGLFPALEPASWVVIDVASLPGDPVDRLVEARRQLAADGGVGRHLLVIDQFEDLLARPDGADGVEIVRTLVASEGGPTVLIALRSDFEPDATTALGDLWREGERVPVPEFGPEDLRAIIEGPAHAKAVFFEPADVVDELIHGVATMPGAASLLSQTLAELYRQARARRLRTGAADRMLSDEDYGATGGAAGIVAQRASALLDGGDVTESDAVRHLFLRFASQQSDGLKRRRVDRDELRFGVGRDALVDDTLDRFVAARLLVVGSDENRQYVEPAHDALVTVWDQQSEWLAQSGSQRVVRDAWEAAADWAHQDHRRTTSKYLWNHNPYLLELGRRAAGNELNDLEVEFLRASSERKTSLARRLVAVVAAVIVALSVAGVAFYLQRNEARQQAQVASSRQLAATAVDLTGGRSHDQALLLAVESFRIGEGQVPRDPATILNRSTIQSIDALLGAVAKWPALSHVIGGQEDAVRATAMSGDGRVVAIADAGGRITRWDTERGELLDSVVLDDPVPAGSVSSEQSRSLALNHNGRVVAAITGAEGDAVWVWDAQGAPRKMAVLPEDLAGSEFSSRPFENLSLDAAGTRLVASQLRGVAAWETSSGARVDELSELPDPFLKQIALGPEADLAVLGGESEQYLVDVADPGVAIATLVNGERFGAAFSSDRCLVAMVGQRPSWNGQLLEGVWFFDLEAGEFRPDPIELSDPASFLAFSPDGLTLAAAVGPPGGEQTLTMWTVSESADGVAGCPVAVPFGLSEPAVATPVRDIARTAITSDGAVLAVSPSSGGAFVWDTSADPAAAELLPGRAVALSADGGTVVFAASSDAESGVVSDVALFDLATGTGATIPVRLNEYSNVPAIAVSNDGRRFATYVDGNVELSIIDAATADATTTVLGPGESEDDFSVFPMSFDPSGDRLAWFSEGSIVVWDIDNGRELSRLDVGYEFDPQIQFSPDGSLVAVARQLWDVASGSPTMPIGLPVAFLADRGQVVGSTSTFDSRGFESGQLQFRELSTGRLRDETVLVAGLITSLAVSPDGSVIASGHSDGSIFFWDAVTAAQIGEPVIGPRGKVSKLAFTVDDGDLRLVSTSERGAFVWGFDAEVWTAAACRSAGRSLTVDEWEALVGTDAAYHETCPS